MALQVNLKKLKKVETPLVGIGDKPVKVEENVELPIFLGQNNQRRTVRQSFIVTRIDIPYNAILDRLLLNELRTIHSP